MKQSKVILIIGEPGTGKTTITKEVIQSLKGKLKQFKYKKLNGNLIETQGKKIYFAGKYFTGEMFEGPDKLSMAVQPDALEFLRLAKPDLLYCDGDRLGNLSFIKACKEMGCEVKVIRIKADSSRLRAARGSSQTEAWVNSRLTKVENICKAVEHSKIENNFGEAKTASSEVLTELQRLIELKK